MPLSFAAILGGVVDSRDGDRHIDEPRRLVPSGATPSTPRIAAPSGATLEDDTEEFRVVVITGAGSAFCAGADLGTRFDAGVERSREAGDRHDVTEEGDPFTRVL